MPRKVKISKKKTKTGRPVGSTIFTKDDFIDRAQSAYEDALRNNRHLSQEDVATILSISRATFCRYLKKYSSWEEIKGDAQWEVLTSRHR